MNIGASLRINRREICGCQIGVEFPTKTKQPTFDILLQNKSGELAQTVCPRSEPGTETYIFG